MFVHIHLKFIGTNMENIKPNNLNCLSFSICFFLLEIFKVLSPDTPIIVSLGETAVLPCYLSPSTNAEDMMVRWFRSKFSFTVHLYQNRKNIGLQIPKYQNRTSFNTSLIADGKVSLSIHSIAPSDEGSYTCLFQSLSFYDAADLELKVSGMWNHFTIIFTVVQEQCIRPCGWLPKLIINCA